MLQLKNISKIYRTGDEDTTAITKINLEVNDGEFVAIIGPSGSGKSTLMHILGLLDTPTEGCYELDKQDVSKIRANRQSGLRNRKIGFVFQQFNLLPRASVLDNVLLPSVYGRLASPLSRAKQLIDQVGLTDRINNKSNQLSGGQIQRVAIARALMMNPSILLADEPTGNLDSKRSAEIMDILAQVNQAGATVVIITHEMGVAKRADRIIELMDGQIVSDRKTKLS